MRPGNTRPVTLYAKCPGFPLKVQKIPRIVIFYEVDINHASSSLILDLLEC